MMQVWKLADYLSILFRGISNKIAKCPCLYRNLLRLRFFFTQMLTLFTPLLPFVYTLDMKAFTSHDLTLLKWTLDRNNWVSFSLANHQVIVGVHLTSKTNKNSFKKLLQSSDPNSSMKCYHSLIIPWEKRVFRRSIKK